MQLQNYDVLCLQAFLAFGNVELNFLTFEQSLEARTADGAEVSKYVGARFLLNKTKTFSFVEPLDRTSCCRHNYKSYKFKSIKEPEDQAPRLEVLLLLMKKQDEVLKRNFEMGRINISHTCKRRQVYRLIARSQALWAAIIPWSRPSSSK